jgi:hypothetical protein
MGGAQSNRANIFPKKVIIHAADVINLSERLTLYKTDKKATIASSLADLEKAFLKNIDEMNNSEKD